MSLLDRDDVFRQLFDAINEALFVHDAEGRIVLVNAQACSMYGATREAILARGIGDLSSNEPPYTHDGAMQRIEQALRDGACTFEWRSKRASGQLFWCEVALRRFELGREPHLMASVRDVDARKEIEEALLRSEQKMAKIFHAASTMLAFTEPEHGAIIDANDAWLRAAGLSREQAIGKTGRELGLWRHPSDRERIVRGLSTAGRLRNVEVDLVMGGRVMPTLLSCEQVDLGGVRYNLWEIVDQTDRKRAEEEQESLRRQFLQAQKMELVGQLAGGVAHDFNNVLTVIGVYTSLIGKGLPEGDPLHAHVEQVDKAHERAKGLTTKLLAFSRRQLLKPRAIDPAAMLEGMSPMLAQLFGEQIQLNIVAAPGTGLLTADQASLEQAIMNLAVNARDAMPDGGTLTIETQSVDVDETYALGHLDLRPGPHVMIAVSDTGHGMDAATRERVFEPFFTTKGPGRGTGLGLSTVFGIVRQCGGAIWLYSEPGRGTCFKLFFPRTSERAPASPEPRAPAIAPGRGQTVLLAEDEPQVRQLVHVVLAAAGYVVLDAGNPTQALAVAQRHVGPIDLLVTDLVMPQMTGVQLAERLRVERPALRVLYMSGYTENTVVRDGVLQEDVNYLPKPFTDDQLLALVARVLA